METDQNLTPSDATGGVRPKHNQGQGDNNSGPRPNRARTDDRAKSSPQRKKYSEGTSFVAADVALVEPLGAPSDIDSKAGRAEHVLVGDSKNCNGGRRSPLGNDKCDSNAAEDICLASVYKGSKYKREEMPEIEDANGSVKRETTVAEDEQRRASPSRDREADLIKAEDESKEKEIPGDNGSTADAALSDSGAKQETKLADVNDDSTDRKAQSADETSEDGSCPNEVRLRPLCSENIKECTEVILGSLTKPNEGAADVSLPLDMTIASAERRQLLAGIQKPAKSEGKLKSDSLRPVGRMLHDLGLDLVRQQVYKDLISIQVAKDSKNMLDEKEKEQLKRLTDAHAKLLVKNAVFQLPLTTCRCGYSSSSENVVALHQEFGSTYEVAFHACCICENFKTRWPSQFVAHIESLHDKKGRVQTKMATNVCKYCPYEHKNQMRMEVHVAKCFKKFNLNTNLQPLPTDCDVPLLGKTSAPGNSHQARPGMLGGPVSFPSPAHSGHQVPKQIVASAANVQPSVMEIGGQLYSLVHHNGKALFTSLRSQMSNSGSGSSSNSNAPLTGVPPGSFPRFIQPPARPVSKDRGVASTPPANQRREKCEMCDAMVNDREALWIHFRVMHKVELSKVSMIEKEPWMMCDVCMAKFWTYQGLARHSMQMHKRELAPPASPTKSFKCFLCLQVQTNPLNHLSTYHNITLLDMYHSRRCCMCNRRFRTAAAFEEHMVLQHHDIFANKDVLCTVLQALSTALSLKRQETVQQRSATPAASMKPGQRSNNSPGGFTGQARSMASPTLSPGQRSTTETPSPSNRGQVDMRKRGHRRQSSGDRTKESETAVTSRTTPKKSTEEDAKELNKLYKDYADIGRPILRSMRHRLSQGGSEKVENASPTAGSKSKEPEKVGTAASTVSENDNNAQAEQDSVASAEPDEEPHAKKLCLESLRNNVETNDSESTDHHKQLQEINNVEMADGQKAS